MAELPYDPAQEKERLSAAIGAVYKYWGTTKMAQAYQDLVQTVVRATQALAAIEPLQDTRGTAFKVNVLGLGGTLEYTRDVLVRVERYAPALAGAKRAKLPSVR